MKQHFLPIVLTLLAVAVSCSKESGRHVPVESIKLSLPEISTDGYVEVTQGNVFEARANVLPANASDTLTWTVQYSDVAMTAFNEADALNHSVVIVGLGVGTTEVTVSAPSGVKETFNVYVKRPTIPLEAIILDIDEITIKDNGSVAIGYSFYPEDANDFYGPDWIISDENVIEYSWEENNEFIVDAVGEGTATVTCLVGDISASCTIHVVSSYVPVTSIAAKVSNVTANRFEAFDVEIAVSPANATTRGFYFEVENPDIVSYEGVANMSGHFVAKKEGSTKVTVISKDQEADKRSTFTVKVDGPVIPAGAVDLGFRKDNGTPVFFRKANLGSEAEIDSGFLYAWGDPTPYYYSKNPYTFREGYEDGYSLNNYKWYNSVSKEYTRYTRNGESLAPEDDPVHQALGGRWYTPDVSEILFLYNNCSHKQEVKSGIHGMTFTSRLEGFEGVSIFLPCGGYLMNKDNFADGNFETWTGGRIYMGCYQTSNVYYNDHEGFYGFVFYDGNIYVRKEVRYLGESIRPIWRGPAD